MEGEKQGSFGEFLRSHRIEKMKKGLRETARLLEISSAHLTDIEKGRRSPSSNLVERISRVYSLDSADLFVRTKKIPEVIKKIATQDTTTAAKVPEFLRVAKDLSRDQWDRIIKNAKTLSKE